MMIYKKIISIMSILLIITNIISVTQAKADENFSGVTEAALRQNIIPLKTVKAGNGFEDMKPLEEILKDKKIVSMGEATHGTKEFFHMKHRMFEFLVEKMGYRLFAMEANFADAQLVNDYVLYGKGYDAYNAVSQLRLAVWQTKEVVDLVEWMREYNKNPEHKSKVKFYGFDIQSIEDSEKILDGYLNKVDKNLIDKVNYIFEDTNKYNSLYYTDLGFTDKTKKLNNIIALFNKNKDKYISKTCLLDYQLVYHQLINAYYFYNRNNIGRDQAMCDNVKWILDYEKQFGNDKIMLWAHNAHVSSQGYSGSMGSCLRKIYGNEMYVIGFEFYDGSFRGRSTTDGCYQKMECIKPEKGTFPDVLNRVNEAIYFIDFKAASANKYINKWLSTWQIGHDFGDADFNQNVLNRGDGYVKPISAYDGIIFVKHATAAEEC